MHISAKLLLWHRPTERPYFAQQIQMLLKICMHTYICVMQYTKQPRNHKLVETLKKLTLNGSCRSASREKSFFREMLEEQNRDVRCGKHCRDRQSSQRYLPDSALSLHCTRLRKKHDYHHAQAKNQNRATSAPL